MLFVFVVCFWVLYENCCLCVVSAISVCCWRDRRVWCLRFVLNVHAHLVALLEFIFGTRAWSPNVQKTMAAQLQRVQAGASAAFDKFTSLDVVQKGIHAIDGDEGASLGAGHICLKRIIMVHHRHSLRLFDNHNNHNSNNQQHIRCNIAMSVFLF